VTVRVQFVGSGDSFGSGGRFQTCILIECPTLRFLLDCGASSLIAMKKQGIAPATIGAIFVTHLHGDHFAGIPFFILDAQFSRREAPLLIAGPPGIQARVRDTMEVLFPRSSETTQRFPLRTRDKITSRFPSQEEGVIASEAKQSLPKKRLLRRLRLLAMTGLFIYS